MFSQLLNKIPQRNLERESDGLAPPSPPSDSIVALLESLATSIGSEQTEFLVTTEMQQAMIMSRTDPEYAVPCTDEDEDVRFPLLTPPASQSAPPQPILDDSGNARTIKACDAIRLLEAMDDENEASWHA